MKLRFDAATIDTPLGYARFIFDASQRHYSDIQLACEEARTDKLVYDAVREWATANRHQFNDLPQEILAALCTVLASPRPKGGPSSSADRDAALRRAALALHQRWPDIPVTRNAATLATPSLASILAEVVVRSEERLNKVLKGLL